VLDFGRAVLNAMTALAAAAEVHVERNMPLVVFKALTRARVLPVEARNLMLATASFRNIIEHEQPTTTKRETAETAMGSAAVAITFIASFFPGHISSDSVLPDAGFEATTSAGRQGTAGPGAGPDLLNLTVTEGDFRDFRSADDDIPF